MQNPKSDYILFLSSDDALKPTYVERCVNVMKNNPKREVKIEEKVISETKEEKKYDEVVKGLEIPDVKNVSENFMDGYFQVPKVLGEGA